VMLPRENGRWSGTPGNSRWFSNNPDAISVTNGRGVLYRNNRPVFSPFRHSVLRFRSGVLDGSRADTEVILRRIMQDRGFSSMNQARNWLRQNGLTPHHRDSITIELVPTRLHQRSSTPHIGSAADLRAGINTLSPVSPIELLRGHPMHQFLNNPELTEKHLQLLPD